MMLPVVTVPVRWTGTVTPPLPPPVPSTVVTILEIVYPSTMRVGVPARVLYRLRSNVPVTSTSVDLIGDGAPGWTLTAPDCRLIAGLTITPTRVGRWDLRISATAGTITTRTTSTRWVVVQP